MEFIRRFRINTPILDCNYIRLNRCLTLFADERIRRLQASFSEVQLPAHELSSAMEFFLQIDGNQIQAHHLCISIFS